MTPNNLTEEQKHDKSKVIYALLRMQEKIPLKEDQITDITDQDILITAKQILFALAVIVIFGFIAYDIRPETVSPILDFCKTCVPPIAAMIIGFYFKDKMMK